MQKLKLHNFGHLILRVNSLEKTSCWKRLKPKEKGAAADEMVRQHHQFNGHEPEQTLGDSEGQGSLACCGPWDREELDMT